MIDIYRVIFLVLSILSFCSYVFPFSSSNDDEYVVDCVNNEANLDKIIFEGTVVIPTGCELSCPIINATELVLSDGASLTQLDDSSTNNDNDFSITIVVTTLTLGISSLIQCDGELHVTSDYITGSGELTSSLDFYFIGQPEMTVDTLSIGTGNNLYGDIKSISAEDLNFTAIIGMEMSVLSSISAQELSFNFFIKNILTFNDLSCHSLEITSENFLIDITLNEKDDPAVIASEFTFSLYDYAVTLHSEELSISGSVTGEGGPATLSAGQNGIIFDSKISVYCDVVISKMESVIFYKSLTITPNDLSSSTQAVLSITDTHIIEMANTRVLGLPSGQGPGCPLKIGVGASHGGKGGKPTNVDDSAIRDTYGSPHAPASGSGAGSLGGEGGGYVKFSGDPDLDDSSLYLGGTLSVAGVCGVCDGVMCGGGGSGGGVLFDIPIITAASKSTSVDASGGDGGAASNYSQSGGGGAGGGYVAFSENVVTVGSFIIDVSGGAGSGQNKQDIGSEGERGVIYSGSLCNDSLEMYDSTSCIDPSSKKVKKLPAWAWMMIIMGGVLLVLIIMSLILYIKRNNEKYLDLVEEEGVNLSVSYLRRDREKALNIDYSQYNVHGRRDSEMSLLSDSSLQ
ncbi:hypothetical protein ADUPG1_006149 [Aduncisulcus paluster]|uniref:Uncharacterized protein n=1 Tax=Aduncisulcus paluster TaxID=2918883 RepID=A0ABQ5KKF4_9EUKA|nr:hypothetical protein ADUPG1_006149 [Aduncisulcus paluster]